MATPRCAARGDASDRERPRIRTLDGLRGAAISLVMLRHLTLYGHFQPHAAIDRLVDVAAKSGWIGVDLFFVLSGFLITGILYDTKGTELYFRRFYIRRCLRIFPLYYAVLTLCFVMLPLVVRSGQASGVPPTREGWYWVYLANVKIAVDGWPTDLYLGHFWSLSVEEQFYFLWPAVIFVLASRSLIPICGTCIFLAFCFRGWLALERLDLAAYVLTPARMDSLAMGSLLALIARQRPDVWMQRRAARLIAIGTGSSLAVIAAWRHGLSTGDRLVYTIGFTLLACFFSAVLMLACTASSDSVLGRLFSSRTLTFLGRYSYGLYVFHLPIVMFTSSALFRVSDLPIMLGSRLPALGIYIAVAGGLSLSAALCSWHVLESRFLALKDTFPYSAVSVRAVRQAGWDVAHASSTSPRVVHR